LKKFRDTNVLELFLKEKADGDKYMKNRIALLFPKEINDVRMTWGSIESHETTLEIIRLLNFRIMRFENYLTRCEGTDGEERFKEYVDNGRRQMETYLNGIINMVMLKNMTKEENIKVLLIKKRENSPP
jgi:hypothetical protein